MFAANNFQSCRYELSRKKVHGLFVLQQNSLLLLQLYLIGTAEKKNRCFSPSVARLQFLFIILQSSGAVMLTLECLFRMISVLKYQVLDFPELCNVMIGLKFCSV